MDPVAANGGWECPGKTMWFYVLRFGNRPEDKRERDGAEA